jgi:hypothetical protein
MPKLYTVKAAATLFSRHEKSILIWIEEGVFPHAFQIKRGWYIPESDIRRVMRSRPEEKPASSRTKPAPIAGHSFVSRWKTS